MRYILCFLSILLLATGCNIKQDSKKLVNKAGEAVGAGASTFADGVKNGVTQTFECSVMVSQALAAKGITTTRFNIGRDSTSTTDNKLTAYLIFDQDFSGTITVKLYDVNNKEYGRASLSVTATKGMAKYLDFVFDQHVDIESKSKFVLE